MCSFGKFDDVRSIGQTSADQRVPILPRSVTVNEVVNEKPKDARQVRGEADEKPLPNPNLGIPLIPELTGNLEVSGFHQCVGG